MRELGTTRRWKGGNLGKNNVKVRNKKQIGNFVGEWGVEVKNRMENISWDCVQKDIMVYI